MRFKLIPALLLFFGLWSCSPAFSQAPVRVCVPGTNASTGGATCVDGATVTSAIAPNNTTGVLLKASTGQVYAVQLGSIGAAPAYLKLYNKATAPTCGTDTPVMRLIIPAAATAANGMISNMLLPASGVSFSAGIGYCVTTGIADSDTTAPAASTFLINIDWN